MTPAAESPVFSPLESVVSLTDQVVEKVRNGILRGDLQAGRLYSTYQLADQIGISRSPVREALLRLAEIGMVKLERNRGFRVVVPGARDIAEVFHLRLLLEAPAAARAARDAGPDVIASLHAELRQMTAAAAEQDETRFMRHDKQLHGLILAAAGNERLAAYVGHLRDLTRLLGASTVGRSRTLVDIAAEHEPIIDALASRDPGAAEAAMWSHVQHTGWLLLGQATAEGRGDDGAGSDVGRGPVDARLLWESVVGG